jgi:hypothetical protein
MEHQHKRKRQEPAAARPVETVVFDGRRTVRAYAAGSAPPPPPAPTPVHRPQPAAFAAQPPPERARAVEDAVLYAAFADIQREVEKFGASGLGTRERGAWEARRLASLGVAPPKRPRIPALIGHGMARKAAERAEAARLGEAEANGTRLGKKRKEAEPGGARKERGVAWGGDTGDAFRGGMLRLAAPEREREEAPLRRGPSKAGKAKAKGRNKSKGGKGKGGKSEGDRPQGKHGKHGKKSDERKDGKPKQGNSDKYGFEGH